MCQPLMFCEQENKSNLHASCSLTFQLQANIDKQLNYQHLQLHFHTTASYRCSYYQGSYIASTPPFDVYTHL